MNLLGHFPNHLHASERPRLWFTLIVRRFLHSAAFSPYWWSARVTLPDAAPDYTGLSLLLISTDRGYNSSIREMLQLWSEQPCRTLGQSVRKCAVRPFGFKLNPVNPERKEKEDGEQKSGMCHFLWRSEWTTINNLCAQQKEISACWQMDQSCVSGGEFLTTEVLQLSSESY